MLLELGRLDEATARLPAPSERAELQDIVYDAAPQIRLRLATGRLDEAVDLAREIAEHAPGWGHIGTRWPSPPKLSSRRACWTTRRPS